jgi:hypothetical protein
LHLIYPYEARVYWGSKPVVQLRLFLLKLLTGIGLLVSIRKRL